ncbi:sigma-70 family RNA polymerase sigma factor [Pseudomonas monteilii]|jgi:transmembrane sensor|uniref:ECF family RNA polymerase sigma-70 factor/transmembrane sensor protein n=2 Tax=Pseudomonas putida group TaxID=136845 RepID=A0AAE6V1G4_9PSED|nr:MULTISPECIES: sigma-70 family RNA polymerase sigma factor [Pseudomonas]MBH3456397.1 sigma-70 family RNA polymerase sigma factor [Pseudomonas monteilii]MDD2123459.1 sigma-70 family RNA polymerase sigma factor [Pseudomonas monteilii]NBB07450.1 sigma-70 family RNA polymerase sigma factor [Pseudomonas monteilii]PXX61953.1 FecR family protein [Pseudomonas sp. LAIL14HWK12:I1]QHB27068.1 ECF family RNA polymerase sigma-70 factor/transmembrane sensor protein [Pseudomonas monteilii]
MLTSPVSGLLASFQEHYDDLLQFLTRRMSDRQRAADVAQETYLKLVKIDEQALPVLHARSFIFRVAGNLAIDALRREQRLAASHDDCDGAGELACPAPAPEAMLLAWERLQILDDALLKLPDNARQALLLNRVEGLTQAQIAQRLGVSESMVAKYIGQALRHCRDWLKQAGVAACVVLLVAATAAWQQAPMLLADYHTAVGERQVITLADGTRVTLNSASALSVVFNEHERRVVLDAGEALFETADEARPFVVETAGERVQGGAATFSVRRDGRVVLARGEATVGERPLAVAADAGTQMAWQRGKLIFNGKPLGQVLAELERYRHGRIVLSDSKLAAMEVSGVFDLDEPEALLRTLEQRYGLKVTYLPWLAVVH